MGKKKEYNLLSGKGLIDFVKANLKNPTDENVLKEKPRKIEDFIITKPMWKTIIGMGILVFALLSMVVFDIARGSTMFGLDLTELFAIFMVINWWNLIRHRLISFKFIFL